MQPLAINHFALDISLVAAEASAIRMTESALEEAVHTTVAAACCLPSLTALAHGIPAVVVLTGGAKNHVRVAVTPSP